jgi:hypothetical protein
LTKEKPVIEWRLNMSNTNKNKTNKNQCEVNTTTEECSTPETTVSIKSVNYARACIILLALNFCVTGYVLVSSLKLQEQANNTNEYTPPQQTATKPQTTTWTPQPENIGATTEEIPIVAGNWMTQRQATEILQELQAFRESWEKSTTEQRETDPKK